MTITPIQITAAEFHIRSNNTFPLAMTSAELHERMEELTGRGIPAEWATRSLPTKESEREWWATAGQLGVIVLDPTDQDYGCVLLEPDEDGKYACVHVKVSMPTIDVARQRLLLWMSNPPEPETKE